VEDFGDSQREETSDLIKFSSSKTLNLDTSVPDLFSRGVRKSGLFGSVLPLELHTGLKELDQVTFSQSLKTNSVVLPIRLTVIRKVGVLLIREFTYHTEGQVNLSVRHQLRDMTFRGREDTVTGETVSVVGKVLFGRTDKTILNKIDSSHKDLQIENSIF
jgi:hypothetical protein